MFFNSNVNHLCEIFTLNAHNLGMQLTVVRPLTHNELKIQCIDELYIRSKIKSWHESITYFHFRCKPIIPSDGRVCNHIWRNKGFDKSILKLGGVFATRFHSTLERDAVVA